MALGENIAEFVKTYFDKDTAVHSVHILGDNIDIVNSSSYYIPEYRLNYFFNTFPLFVLYLLTSYDNAECVNRFLSAVDRWPAHNSLSLDVYPTDKTVCLHNYDDYDSSDILAILNDKLTSSSEIILDSIYEDMIAHRAANISEDHRYMIGAVVDKFSLYLKILAYEPTFHKYRGLIDFIYYIGLKYEYHRYRLDIGVIDEAKFKDEIITFDINDGAINDYVWYRDGDFYDKMFDTGYTANEWEMYV